MAWKIHYIYNWPSIFSVIDDLKKKLQQPWSDFQNNFQNAFLGIWTKMNNKHKLLLRFPMNKLGHKPTITYIRTLKGRWKPTRNDHRIYSTGILTVFSDFGKTSWGDFLFFMISKFRYVSLNRRPIRISSFPNGHYTHYARMNLCMPYDGNLGGIIRQGYVSVHNIAFEKISFGFNNSGFNN